MPARILVIEDNEESLFLMNYLLTAFGHTVVQAQDGQEGLEAARRELPDLILTDIQMPRLDGYQVVKACRADPRLRKCPVIAVTSFAMRGDRERGLSSGFDGYISKPIVPEEFVAGVEKFLHPGLHSLRPPAVASDEPRENPLHFHTTILAVDNSPVNLSLIQSTLEPHGYKVIPVATVREALIHALAEPPDLILSDLHMPDVDGFDFFKALKTEPKLKSVPFVIISSTFWPDTDLVEALDLGISKFLLRPIEPPQLVAEIEACLAGSRAT